MCNDRFESQCDRLKADERSFSRDQLDLHGAAKAVGMRTKVCNAQLNSPGCKMNLGGLDPPALESSRLSIAQQQTSNHFSTTQQTAAMDNVCFPTRTQLHRALTVDFDKTTTASVHFHCGLYNCVCCGRVTEDKSYDCCFESDRKVALLNELQTSNVRHPEGDSQKN